MRYALIIATIFLAGCSYKAQVMEAPPFDVVSSYGEKIPGRWLLYVESESLNRPIKPSGFACSAHSFPIDAAVAFRTSVHRTLSNLVQTVEVVNSPIAAGQVASRGAQGAIVVRGEEVRSKLDVQPGFWTAGMATEAVLVASVTVDGHSGRLFGTTVEGRGFANSEAA